MKFITCCALIAIAISAPCNAFAEKSGEQCDRIGETRLATGGNDIIACLADEPDGKTGHYKSQVFTTPECRRAFSDVIVRQSHDGSGIVFQAGSEHFYVVQEGTTREISRTIKNAGYGAHYYRPKDSHGSKIEAVAAECDSGWIKTSCEIVAAGDGTPAGRSAASETLCIGGHTGMGTGFVAARAGITCCKTD